MCSFLIGELLAVGERWNPHDYQKYCVHEGFINKFLAFLLDPGLGKTSIILKLYQKLRRVGKAKGILVIAPLRPCYMVWPKEVQKWTNFKNISFTVLHKEWGDMDYNFSRKKDIYIINPEGLPWLLEKLKGKRKTKWPFDMLVVDESTKFKNTSSIRWKLLKKMVPKFNRRYILTGTPAPNGLQNIQGQLYIVDQGQTFGTAKSYFLPLYFRQIGRPEWNQWEPIAGKLDKFYKKFAKFAIRLKAEDYLDLPDKIVNIINIELPKKARKQYDSMEKEMFMQLESGEKIIAMGGGSSYQKCHQLANGALYVYDESIIQPGAKIKRPTKFEIIHNAKIEALENLIDELNGKPLLIAYNYQHDIKRLKKHFGKSLVSLGDNANMLDCVKIEKKWNKGKIQLLAAYPGTAALGLNLQKGGNDICFFSMVEDYEAEDQFIKRILRQGVEGNKVRVHYLIARNTVDVVIARRTLKKEKRQTKFLNAIYEYRKNRLQQFKDKGYIK